MLFSIGLCVGSCSPAGARHERQHSRRYCSHSARFHRPPWATAKSHAIPQQRLPQHVSPHAAEKPGNCATRQSWCGTGKPYAACNCCTACESTYLPSLCHDDASLWYLTPVRRCQLSLTVLLCMYYKCVLQHYSSGKAAMSPALPCHSVYGDSSKPCHFQQTDDLAD